MPARVQPRWTVSFRSSDALRDEERAAEAGGDPCSRDARCSGRRITVENGERIVTPARTYGPFCTSCQALIASCLSELPAAWSRLAAETAEMHRRGAGGHAPFGPRLPFDASYDELCRRIGEVLLSWEERVRLVVNWSALDTQASRRGDQHERVESAVRTLTAEQNFTVLLALQPGPMFRSIPHMSSPDDVTLLELGGREAGEEILDLHRRALLLLGEIVRQREVLPGVPCKRCEEFALERAEPPSDPSREAMWSRCASCDHSMDRRDYDSWAKWYGKWADGLGLACRRCQLQQCGACEYERCACASQGHAGSLVA